MSLLSILHRRIGFFLRALKHWRTVPYFGFIQGHGHLSDAQMVALGEGVGRRMSSVVEEFEQRYAAIIGDGESVSFASGRMGFFALMQHLGVGQGDEVILPGATCSVMVNAVLRVGAKPVYADVDSSTYGSDSKAIEKVLSPRTKMIVAQHSFGIPCNIVPIVALAKLRNIFLLEDCALTVGSKINGKVIGNFGDAALFSTDHSKPINTLIGGMVYSHQYGLISALRMRQRECGELSVEKQKFLFYRVMLERKYCHPGRYGRMAMLEYYRRIFKKGEVPFLDDDFGTDCNSIYPYPAQLPGFLALLGIMEIERWPQVMLERKNVFNRLLKITKNFEREDMLTPAYKDENLDIVPLRFVWHCADGFKQRMTLSDHMDVSWTWFMQPIVATSEPLECFDYRMGACPVAESIGDAMVNLPCNIPGEWVSDLVLCLDDLAKERVS